VQGIMASAYRLVLRAAEPLDLPGEKGTMLRGGFGVALKRVVCAYPVPAARECGSCPLRATCVFPRLFDAVLPDQAKPRDGDAPRPFVFRVPRDRRTHYEEGDTLDVEFVLIGWAREYLPYVTLALASLADGGMGPVRGHFALREVWSVDPFGRAPLRLDADVGTAPAHTIDWTTLRQRAAGLPADGVTVRFLTPTRFVTEHRPMPRPSFYALIAALRRRAEALSRYHCGVAWAPDYEALAEAARRVGVTRERLAWRERTRRSTRDGDVMPMGGVMGEMVYVGDMRLFRELLALGEVIHAGKCAAFGNGQICCEAPCKE